MPVGFPNINLARLLTTGGVNRADRRSRQAARRRPGRRVLHLGRVTLSAR